MDEFKFSPEKGFLDSAKFPDPGGEQDARTQLMSLHNQTRDFINKTLIPEINTIKSATGDPEAIQNLLDEIKKSQSGGSGGGKSYVKVPLVLLASEWKENKYTITDSHIKGPDETDQEFALTDTATDAQILMWQKANIQDGGQVVGSATLRAIGEVPTADIPVTMIVWG